MHEFAEREIVPIAARAGRKRGVPAGQRSRRWPSSGLLGLLVPERVRRRRSQHCSTTPSAIEEISWADASHSVVMSVNNSLVCEPIVRFGTDAQKQRFLPSLANGDYVGAYCLSEPTSGSDASNMSTRRRARRRRLRARTAPRAGSPTAARRAVPGLRGHQHGRAQSQRHQRVPDSVRHAWAAGGREREEARHSRVEYDPDLLRGLPRAGRRGARQRSTRASRSPWRRWMAAASASAPRRSGIAQRALDETVKYSK